jgi:protein subunit release factor A
MPVRQSKLEALEQRMALLGIREKDLKEQFVLASGRGGQKVQKTSSCVVLKHVPTGAVVRCERERFREINRYLARRSLCEWIERRQHHPLALPSVEEQMRLSASAPLHITLDAPTRPDADPDCIQGLE